MSRSLDAYRGQLTPAQVAEGVNSASRNSARLAGDAKLLLENGRFPSAASIAVLAIEEAGKTSILRGLAVANDDEEIKKEWKAYRSHTSKNVQWILPRLVTEGARKLGDLRSIFDRDSDHPLLLNNIKQLGFYTDCLGDAHWTEPAEIVDEQIAKMLVEVAQILCQE
jgi:AbiV family abortive infection protein